MGALWRLVGVVSAIQIIDLSLLSSLGPLLPELDERFDLGLSGAGRLVAAYAVGSLVTTVPAGFLAGRIGYRGAMLAGLAIMAVSSVAFGFAPAEEALWAARFGQGIASAISWAAGLGWVAQAAPPERRGATLGIVMGATVVGSLSGPALGALAAQGDRVWTFVGVGGIAAVLALPVARLPGVPAARQRLRELAVAVRSPLLLAGLLLFLLPAFLIAAQTAVAPLELSGLGWSAGGIGAIAIVSAVIQIGLNPLLGRWSDRSGRLPPVFAALAASAATSALLAAPFADGHWTLAVLVLVSSAAFAAFYVPASAVLADGADEARLGQGYGFALANLAWSPGTVVGSLVGGAVAGAAGDEAAFLLLAAVCAGSLAGLLALRPRLRGQERA